MKNNFFCPKCHGNLNVGGYVIFSVKTQGKKYGLVLLNPEVGDYSAIKHDDFKPNEGELSGFFCPMCHASLIAMDVDENLVRIYMVDEEKKKHEILFSGIVGEKCTYKITDGIVEEAGESKSDYVEKLKSS